MMVDKGNNEKNGLGNPTKPPRNAGRLSPKIYRRVRVSDLLNHESSDSSRRTPSCQSGGGHAPELDSPSANTPALSQQSRSPEPKLKTPPPSPSRRLPQLRLPSQTLGPSTSEERVGSMPDHNHRKKLKSAPVYRCSACVLTFPDKQTLDLHCREMHPKPGLVCPLCRSVFLDRGNLNKHVCCSKPDPLPES